MALSWGIICQWNEAYLNDAADDMRLLRQRALDAQRDMESAASNFISQGDTAEAIRGELHSLNAHLSGLVQETSDIMMAFADASDGVWKVRTRVLECQEYAQQHPGLFLDAETGAVDADFSSLLSRPANPVLAGLYDPMLRFEVNDLQLRLDTLEEMVRKTLQFAEEVQHDLAGRLKALQDIDPSERPVGRSSSHSPGLPDLPQPDWSPTETAIWWSTLSKADKQWLLDHHPRALGNLDGVEYSWRDKANRRALEEYIREQEAILAEPEPRRFDGSTPPLQSHPFVIDGVPYAPEWVAWNDRQAKARRTLEDLHGVSRALGSDSTSSLIALDMTGHNAKAAVALGNLDSADHVGIFVPGMGTRLHDRLEGYVKDAAKLKDATQYALTRSERVSTVVTVAWLNYDAPDDVWEDNWTEVVATDLAHEGANRLSSFAEGMSTTHRVHGNGDAHVTVLGHSYGSTTAGMAAAQVQQGAIDDLVLFGSPGSGVQSIDEYNITSDTPYVAGVPERWWGDPVQDSGFDESFGRDPMKMPGFEHLSDESPGGTGRLLGRHGTDTYMHPDSGILEDMAKVTADTKRNP